MLKRHRLHSEIVDIISLTPTVKEIHLKMPDEFVFHPGQYVTLSLEHEGKIVSRSYSICSSPMEKGIIKLCIKIISDGKFTPLLNHLALTDKTNPPTLKVVGPMGNFTLAEEHLARPKVFIATGTGLSPVMSMILYNLEKTPTTPITLLTGYRYTNEILYLPLWQKFLEKHSSFNYRVAITRPQEAMNNSIMQSGRIQALFENQLDRDLLNDPDTLFYLCGLSQMILDSKEKLIKMGVREENIHYEQYD